MACCLAIAPALQSSQITKASGIRLEKAFMGTSTHLASPFALPSSSSSCLPRRLEEMSPMAATQRVVMKPKSGTTRKVASGTSRRVASGTARKPAKGTTRKIAPKASASGGGGDNRSILLAGAGAVIVGLGAYLVSPDAIGAIATTKMEATTGNEVAGTVTFTEVTSHFGKEYVRVQVDLIGLAPGKHGFHVHERGNVTCFDGLCTGGHFNPDGTQHGAPRNDAKKRHAGDLGNIVASESGVAKSTFLDPLITLHGPNTIVGRSVVIHAGEDDFVTQPTGNSGGRVAFGTIKS